MTKTFCIGDFLFVDGDSLKVDLGARSVTGFSRLRLVDGAVQLEFDAAPQGDPPNAHLPGTSTLSWGSAATTIPGGIDLDKGEFAWISFRWRNPLTPRSAGLFFRLGVVNNPPGYRLRFQRYDDASGPEARRNFGYGYFEAAANSSEFFYLAKSDGPLSLKDWRALWLNTVIPTVPAKAIQEAALFRGASSLIDGEPRHQDWKFGWQFSSDSDGYSRAIAAVDVEGESLAVSAKTLRLEERAEIRPRPLHWERKLSLRCANVRSNAGPSRQWVVDWIGVPTVEKTAPDERKDHLSLRSFWQELARHWALGLRSLRSRNALTVVPTDISEPDDAAELTPWTFRFLCTPSGGGWWSGLAAIGREEPAVLRFELASLLSTSARVGAFSAVVSPRSGPAAFQRITDVDAVGLESLLSLEIGPSPNPLGQFLVGGLVLDAQTLQRGELRVAWGRVRTELGQPPIDVALDLKVQGGMPRPGTEDPERGFESENDLLQRERPLVVDLTAESTQKTTIQFLETASSDRSRVLEVLVRNADVDGVAGAADVVVIDPAPMLVARVRSKAVPVKPGAILASYRDDGERPPGWELPTETGAMTLILPPQAIGEEMIKGLLKVRHLGQDKSVPFTDRPFDFRLSPPAILELDRTDINTARAATPWALRRLLDRREAVVGLKLDSARFELLYGLRTRLDKVVGVRVAEQAAFVGRVPMAPGLRDRAEPSLFSKALFVPAERDYALKVVRWIRSLLARPAQLPAFRDFASRDRISLVDGVSFDFRPTRQTTHPLALDKRSLETVDVPSADFADGRLRLRGGVDFPFESEKIYNAVFSNDKASPGEPQGHVTGLTFGALGGSGSQTATFDEGRSMLISETSQGRLSSLTLIRVGRIAMLWHHARHVIVYERTTRTVPRYRQDQPNDFEGLAALRKVKEYVEIQQPHRAYPDFPMGATERPPAGPLVGCGFETVVIPVKSSWGHDIEDGFVMALRGPLLEDEQPFYPMPKIFPELARAEAKGGGAINHLVSDPSQLSFFTTTKAGLGADTDRWPAWPDIDFPLTRRPGAPKVRFLPGFSGGSRQPDAATHDYGQRRFTIDVIPPEEAVNLLHGRSGNGLEARVRNVSLLRGDSGEARSAIDEAVGSTLADGESLVGDSLAELAQHLERIAQRGAATVGEVEGLRMEARLVLAEARNGAESMRAALEAGKSLIDAGMDTWSKVQQRGLSDATAAAARLRKDLSKQFQEDIAEVARRLEAATPQVVAEAETSVRAASESICRQLEQRLESIPFVGAEVKERLEAALQSAQTDIQGLFSGLSSAWHAHVDETIDRFASEDPSALQAELFEVVLAGRAQVTAFAVGFVRALKASLGPLFGDIVGDPGAIGRLTEIVSNVARQATEGVDETLDVIPPFELHPPDAAQLNELLDAIFPEISASFDEIIEELFRPLLAPVSEWRAEIDRQTAAIRALREALTSDLVAAVGRGSVALKAIAAATVKKWDDTAAAALKGLADEAARRAVVFESLPVSRKLQGGIERAKFLKEQVLDTIDEISGELDDTTKSVREIADRAHALADRATAGMRRIGEEVEQAVATELRHVVAGTQGAALELSRALAEGPITDTMRCTRDWVGYYYQHASDTLEVTRAAAVFNDLGGEVLNSLTAQVPFDRIRDRLLAQLGNFDVSKLFPDFAGLKLEHLLGSMTVPSDPNGEYDWIKMRHGFDRARLTAWSEVSIDKLFDDSPELFTLPPVALSVVQPRFTASSRIEVDTQGVRAQRTQARLVADWTVTLNGELIMSIEKGGLYFDNEGGFRFDFEPNDLQLAPALQFITDSLRSLLPPDQGLTLTPLFPGGISVELSLPLPDIGAGAFTLTGITLFTHFDLLVANGFEVRTGAWLSRPERPFGMAVLFLGGGGWFGVDVRYKPPKEFETRVSLGLAAGAFVALNFGVARGSAGVLFTVGLDFYRNWLQSGSQDLGISIGILVWGEFSIVGIVSAYLRIVLRIEYRNGEMTGYGNVSVSIKICWCFTLRVNSSIRLPFKKGGRSAIAPAALMSTEGRVLAAPALVAVVPATVAQAIDAHFSNLDV